MLSPAYEKAPGSAPRIRSGMRLVFRFAMAHGWAERDLAGEAIAAAPPKTRPGMSEIHGTSRRPQRRGSRGSMV